MVERLPSVAAIEGRISTSAVAKNSSERLELLPGTLDMLVLRTLLISPAHGRQLAGRIQRATEDVLQVEHGSLYAAVHRLERKASVASKREMARDRDRELKHYRLHSLGKKQLVVEESKGRQVAGAIARVMWPAGE
jgi:transcriptional regulator